MGFALLLCAMWPADAAAQLKIGGRKLNTGKLLEAGKDVAKAVTLSDKDIADLSREAVEWMDANNPIADETTEYGARLKRLTDIMNSYLLLICISFVPASVSICATLPLWFSKHMQNRIIRLSGLALLSLIMAGGLLLAFACQDPWFGLSCIAVSSMNIPLFRHYELLLSTLRCSKCHHISLHLLSVHKNTYELTCSHCGFHKRCKK